MYCISRQAGHVADAPPHEIHSDVIGAIAALEPEHRKTNAAELVFEALARVYPCRLSGAKP